jgi:hypothetical protein
MRQVQRWGRAGPLAEPGRSHLPQSKVQEKGALPALCPSGPALTGGFFRARVALTASDLAAASCSFAVELVSLDDLARDAATDSDDICALGRLVDQPHTRTQRSQLAGTCAHQIRVDAISDH